MKKLLNIIFFILFSLASPVLAGTAYYADCTISNGLGGDGTSGNPFESIRDINAGPDGGWVAGDDVYLLENSTCTVGADGDSLAIDWAAGDGIKVGCYDAKDDFSCDGDRPIIDGVNTYPTDTNNGLIGEYGNPSNVTIEYIHIKNSGGDCLEVSDADNWTIDDIICENPDYNGIVVARTPNSSVTNSTAFNAGTATIIVAIGNFWDDSACNNITISGNTVYGDGDVREGIGLYQNCNNSLVEGNVSFDTSAGIYVGASGDGNIVRYNLIYSSTSQGRSWMYGIYIGCEDTPATFSCTYPGGSCASNNEVYGNLIAGVINYGFNIGNNCANNGAYIMSGNSFHNNTVIDSGDYEIRVHCEGSTTCASEDSSGNTISDNIFWTKNGLGAAYQHHTINGWTWTHNLFDDDVTGGAENNAVELATVGITPPTPDFNALAAGSVDGSEFVLNATSDAINAASQTNTLIDPTDVNFTTSPIVVGTVQADEIGAMALRAYYVDCSDDVAPYYGTFADPWNDPSQISISDRDDVYFKYGTTCTYNNNNDTINLSNIDGTSSDRVIIGCYESEFDFDCTGQTYPILNGNELYPGDYSGLIRKADTDVEDHGYVTIQQLHFKDWANNAGEKSERLAISIAVTYAWSYANHPGKTTDNIVIDDCEFSTPGSDNQGAILFGRYKGEVKNSYFHHLNAYQYQPGSAPVITAIYEHAQAWVHHNKMHNVRSEGLLGAYQGGGSIANPSIVEYNEIWNINHMAIGYLSSTDGTIARYNLAYQTNDVECGGGGNDNCWQHSGAKGIVVGHECWVDPTVPPTSGDGVQVYGNLIVGFSRGIQIYDDYQVCQNLENCTDLHQAHYCCTGPGTGAPCDSDFENMIVANNTLIGNAASLWTGTDGDTDFGSLTIQNNISDLIGGGVHLQATGCSASGITWGYNHWDSDPGASPCDSVNDPTRDPWVEPLLAKTTGWDSLTKGAVTGAEFAPGPLSTVIDQGTSLGPPYSSMILASNYAEAPIAVSLGDQGDHGLGPEIGAVIHNPIYYVDCDWTGVEEGTYDEPFNSVADVNNHPMFTGTDVYFKKDVECEVSGISGLKISWDGTAEDNVVIGCYDGENDFDCGTVFGVSGYGIIDGDTNEDDTTNMNGSTGLIENFKYGTVDMHSYITIQNMKLQWGALGLVLNGETTAEGRRYSGNGPDGNITVKNSWFYRNEHGGWGIFGNIENVTLTGNLNEQSVYQNIRTHSGSSGGACAWVQPAGQWNGIGQFEGWPKNIVWENGHVKNCGREWINITDPDGMWIRNMRFYGLWSINYGINLISHNIGLDPLYIENNLFEGYPDCDGIQCDHHSPIVLGDWTQAMDECLETEEEILESPFMQDVDWGQYPEFYEIYIRGNLFAGWAGPYNDGEGANSAAVLLANGMHDRGCPVREFENIYIDNNTSIDNDTFMRFSNHHFIDIVGNTVYLRNNIVWITDECVVSGPGECAEYACYNYNHVATCYEAAETATFDGNLYRKHPVYRIDADQVPLPATWAEGPNDPGHPGYSSQVLNLAKMTGWRNLTLGQLDGTEFRLLAASQALNNGLNLGVGGQYAILDPNFKVAPTDIVLANQNDYGPKWEIGSLVSELGVTPKSVFPLGGSGSFGGF